MSDFPFGYFQNSGYSISPFVNFSRLCLQKNCQVRNLLVVLHFTKHKLKQAHSGGVIGWR